LDELQRVARRYARKTHAVRGKPGRKPKSLDAQNWADGALEGLLTGFVGLIRTAVRQELRSIINVADAG
jgi:hypothetical protein